MFSSRVRRSWVAALTAAVVIAWGVGATGAPAATSGAGGGAALWSDFNGDGYADLAVGVPEESVGGMYGSGAVNVLYGSAAGLTPTGNQFWNQDQPDVLDSAEEGDAFGEALASGDFDGDGYADLAVGVPAETLDELEHTGAVAILYGSPSGLTAGGNQLWSAQDLSGHPSSVAAFGRALAAGDFNADGYADLALGVPGDSRATLGAGSVSVIYGTNAGLAAVGTQSWHQDAPDILDKDETGDEFGSALAAGDLNGDGFDDLAVGVPGEDVSSKPDSGAVNVVYGSAAGLVSNGNQYWNQDRPDILDKTAKYENFGRALAAADLDGDGFDDVAIGVPEENVSQTVAGGAINVIYGSPAGLASDGNQYWNQDKGGILDKAESMDMLGASLTAGDFDGDGFRDLAMGVPKEIVNGYVDAGAASVIYGSPFGLTSARNQFWNQDKSGILDSIQGDEGFGLAVNAADFDGDGRADLAVGVPYEDVGGARSIPQQDRTASCEFAAFQGAVYQAGAINVIYGSASGLTSADDQFWSQDSPEVLDQSNDGDHFGSSVGEGAWVFVPIGGC